jgi:hypothetical protein
MDGEIRFYTVPGKQYEVRNEEQGARMIFRTKLDGPITRNKAASRRGAIGVLTS